MKTTLMALAGLYLLGLAPLHGSDTEPPKWDLAALAKEPETNEAQEAKVAGLQSLYVAGLPFNGRETKFYAYLGFPANRTGKLPAVVLVHGGGGTASAGWVKYWNAKGYVALSMDNEGHVPVDLNQNVLTSGTVSHKTEWQSIDSLKLPWAGGPHRLGAYDDSHLPIREQWMYHAVAETVLSLSLLASLSEVDSTRIGVVGISWGSVICSLAGGIDQRLAFVVPQYIGGNLMLGNFWIPKLRNKPSALRWDPANFYPNPASKAKWLWIDGINDTYGVPPMITKSWHDTGPNSWMTFLPTQGHGGNYGETGKNALREIYAFADSVTHGTPALARILGTKLGKGEVTLIWKAENPINHAQLCYTADPLPMITDAGESRKDWTHVKYTVLDIPLPPVTTNPDGTMQASFPLPGGTKAGIINLIDERGLTVSGDLVDIP